MNENRELQELLEKCLEGNASAEEQVQVIESAEESEELGQVVLETAEMDSFLRNMGSDEGLFSEEVVKRIMNKGKSGPFARVIREKIEKEQVKPLERASERLRAMRGQKKSESAYRLNRQRKRRLISIIWFSLAACLVITAGAFFFNLWQVSQIPEIIKVRIGEIYGDEVYIERNGTRIHVEKGTVLSSGDTVITGKDSLCRVDSKDGSIVALNENTDLTFRIDQHSLNSLTYRKGQIFADIPEQKRTFSVNIGNTALTVLGTRFQIRKSYDEKYTTVDVFKGTVKVREKILGGYITEGHTGYFVGYDSGNPDATRDIRKGLYIIIPVETIPVDWLNKVNLIVRDILSAYKAHKKAPLIDFNNYWIRDGIWKLEQKENDTVISQEMSDCDMASILFGKATWKRGTVSVDFKVNKYASGDGRKRVSICFFYDKDEMSKRSYESFGLSDQLERLRKEGYTGWINLKIDFKIIDAQNALELRMYFDPVPKGVPKGSYYDFRKDPKNSIYKYDRKKVGIGLNCSGLSAEFRNFKIIPR